jgi:hypothetical protein
MSGVEAHVNGCESRGCYNPDVVCVPQKVCVRIT